MRTASDARLDQPTAFEALLKRSSDPSEAVRMALVERLGALGGKRGMEELWRIARDDTSPNARGAATVKLVAKPGSPEFLRSYPLPGLVR